MDSSPDKNGFHKCINCHGGGVSKQMGVCINLLEACPRCYGSGKLDWITNVMNNSSLTIDREGYEIATRNAVLSNIKLLQSRIIEEGMKIGIQIKLNMEFKDLRQMHLETTKPLIIPGGNNNVPY
jgi:hypothetical protein